MLLKITYSLITATLILTHSISHADQIYSIADLDKTLTPVGAVRAGNTDQSIPEWQGGIKKPPANYKQGDHHPDPFSDDKVLFTINATNADQYKSQLTTGQLAMLKQYPDFIMPVYPTRRSASFPQRIYELSIANANTAKLIDDGNGVDGAVGGTPFPIPANGLQAIWNHTLRYRGEGGQRIIGQAAVTSSGAYTLLRYEDEFLFYYGHKGMTAEKLDNKIFKYRQLISSPARLAGRILLAHETINAVKEPRSVWIYNPGQRRVRRAPDVVYDSPPPGTDALRTVDQFDMYNGAPDRYNWKLIGREERYVPYNAYKLHAENIAYDEIIKPQHINQTLTRYELHRVWIVEATLKPGKRHIYAKRTFYMDEDSWQILAIDQYDNNNKLWRVSEAHTINYYDIPATWSTLELHYDLQSRRYLAFGLNNQEKMPDYSTSRNPSFFTPSALRRSGRR